MNSLYRQFPAMAPLNNTLQYSQLQNYDNDIKPGKDRSALEQSAYQLAALVLTLSISCSGGLLTGKQHYFEIGN